MATTLNEVVVSIADQLARNDLNEQITKEIGLAVQKYSRKLTYLTEVRGGTLLMPDDRIWYSTFNIAQAAGLQDKAGRVAVPFSNVVKVNFVRYASPQIVQSLLLQNGGALLLEDERNLMLEQLLADPRQYNVLLSLQHIHYSQIEEYGTFYVPFFRYGYSVYAGQMGVWPRDPGSAVYISANVKPMVPNLPDDTSVFFDEALALIEAEAASQVCAKYIQDAERAATFAVLAQTALSDVQQESNTKAATGRIRPRW